MGQGYKVQPESEFRTKLSRCGRESVARSVMLDGGFLGTTPYRTAVAFLDRCSLCAVVGRASAN